MKTKIGRDRQDLINSKKNREKENDAEIQGEITGLIYRNGPIPARACTDVFCCVFYVLFLILLITITGIAAVDGDVKYLYTGYDSDYNACGVGDLESYPYLYFAEPETNVSATICVAACPSSSDSTLDCYINSAITTCSESEIYSTSEYNGVACVPTDSTQYEYVSGYLSQGYWEYFQEIFLDTWLFYLIIVGVSFLVTLILLTLKLFFAKVIAWLFIVLSITMVLAAASLFMILYANPDVLSSTYGSISDTSSSFELAISIILYIVGILAVVMVYFKRKKIAAALAFMETTSLFLKQIWTSLFLPLIFLIIFLGYVVYAVYLALLILTLGEVNTSNITSPFGLIYPNTEGWVFLLFHLVGTFINLSFIVCTYQFILYAACSYWYFSTPTATAGFEESDMQNALNTNKKKSYPLWNATKIYFNYHLGSVVVSSILISLFSWFNFLFSHIYNKIAKWRDYAESKSFVHIFLTGVLCLFYFYEKFIRYISRNAFFQITITGNHFYDSSKEAFYLVQRNNNSYYPIQGLGDIIIFMGQLFIILGTCIAAFVVFLVVYSESLTLSLWSTLVAFIISLCACNLTMLIYSAINDAVLMNYLLDVEIEINNFGKSKPYHAPLPLKTFLDDPAHQKDLFNS